MSSQNTDNVMKAWEGNDDADSEASCDSCDLKIDIPENEVTDPKQRSRKRKYQDIEPDEEMMAVISGMEEEIERQLDAKAAKSHLTATNVKNILKTIITDEHVLGMVRQALLGKYDSLDIPYEPKITRAKAKQMQGSQPNSAIGTPVKRPATSRCHVLIEQELPEDTSDDEEYQPTNEQEQSDDDKEMETTKETNDDSMKSSGEDTGGEEEEEEAEEEEESEKESDSGSESDSDCDSEEGEENEDNTSEGHHEGLEIDSDEELESESDESSSSESEEEEETDGEGDTTGDKDVVQNKGDECEEPKGDVTPVKELNENEIASEVNSHKAPVDAVHVNNSDSTCSKSERSPHVSFLLPDDNHKTHLADDECSNLSGEEDSCGMGKESIGQRTRSKLSLSDTPLEAIERAFIPPDITTDMYDSECDDEDWKNFLKDFTEPLLPDMNNTVDDDEDADPEYNILADVEEAEMEEEKEDKKEECRIDRAVKVSKKEVNALVKELFKMAGVLSSSDDEDDENNKKRNKVLSLENDTETCQQMSLTPEQRLLLDQQMRQHVQLTTQNYLQTFCHPKYNIYAAECKKYLVNLNYLSGNNPKSAYYAGNLKEALSVIEEWEKHFSSPNKRLDLTRFFQTQINKRLWLKNVQKKSYLSTCDFPPKLMEIVSNSKVFMYTSLLPSQPFRCDGAGRPCFVPAEEQLLVIGLEQFMDYAQKNPEYFPKKLTYCNVTPYISQLMMPAKEPRQLYIYIYKRANEHPFKHYFEHQKAPGTIHYVLPYTSSMPKAPKDHPKQLLPEIWLRYLYPNEQKS